MSQTSRSGLLLALAGALILTPDALFMRWSEMDGFQMLGWRGTTMALVFYASWLLTSSSVPRDLRAVRHPVTGVIILCHALSAAFFPIGVAAAPVASVLIGIATTPVWSALLARLLFNEPTHLATWLATSGTLIGVLIAVSDTGSALDANALIGMACGLGVAAMLALNFVLLRHNPDVPILPAIGTGAVLAGLAGWIMTGPSDMMQGHLPFILVTGLVFLPASFFAFSQASRLTHAANVSLLLLLETILAPIWVWWGIGESPSARMLVGGALVVLTLSLYLAFIRSHPARLRIQKTHGLADDRNHP